MADFGRSSGGRFGRERSGGRFDSRSDGGSRFGGGRFGGNSRGGRDRDFSRGPPRMHDATCSTCGKACQVPFRPTGEKPVLCNECFGNAPRAPSFSRNAPSAGASSEQFAQINAKLDKILRVLQELEIDTGDEVSEDVELAEEEPADGEDESSDELDDKN